MYVTTGQKNKMDLHGHFRLFKVGEHSCDREFSYVMYGLDVWIRALSFFDWEQDVRSTSLQNDASRWMY